MSIQAYAMYVYADAIYVYADAIHTPYMYTQARAARRQHIYMYVLTPYMYMQARAARRCYLMPCSMTQCCARVCPARITR